MGRGAGLTMIGFGTKQAMASMSWAFTYCECYNALFLMLHAIGIRSPRRASAGGKRWGGRKQIWRPVEGA